LAAQLDQVFTEVTNFVTVLHRRSGTSGFPTSSVGADFRRAGFNATSPAGRTLFWRLSETPGRCAMTILPDSGSSSSVSERTPRISADLVCMLLDFDYCSANECQISFVDSVQARFTPRKFLSTRFGGGPPDSVDMYEEKSRMSELVSLIFLQRCSSPIS